MRQTIDPAFEFNWGPALWGAAVVVAVGLVANLVLAWPNLLSFGAVAAGFVVAFRSDYYEPSGQNAIVGAILGSLVLTPVLVYMRVTFVFGIEQPGDTVFVSFGYGVVWLVLVMILLLPLAYIGAVLGDATRKRVGGSLGYQRDR